MSNLNLLLEENFPPIDWSSPWPFEAQSDAIEERVLLPLRERIEVVMKGMEAFLRYCGSNGWRDVPMGYEQELLWHMDTCGMQDRLYAMYGIVEDTDIPNRVPTPKEIQLFVADLAQQMFEHGIWKL